VEKSLVAAWKKHQTETIKWYAKKTPTMPIFDMIGGVVRALRRISRKRSLGGVAV
jgi:hypothetical protein